MGNNRVASSQGKVREIQGQGKVRKFCSVMEFFNFEKRQGNLGKSSESPGKLTFLSRAYKVKRSHDVTNWKHMCIAIQQKSKCNVHLEDPTLEAYTI